MSAAPVRVLAGMTLRDLVRRRTALVLLIALPVAFYLVRHDSVGQSVRSLVFGVTWSVTTVAFFAAVSARSLEPRLGVAGWSRRTLVSGRLAGLLVLGAALAVAYAVLVAVDQDVRSPGLVALDFGVTVLVAMAVGTALGAVTTRELDGALVIFFLAGLGAIVNPFDAVAKLLPFWSSREIGTVAVDGPAQASVAGGLAHAVAVIAACALVTALARRR